MMGMSKIVRTISGLMFPFIMIYGLYVIAHGHLTPGGGFQGGAIVASGLIMILIAFGSKWTLSKIKEHHLSIFESLGALAFITFAFIGIFYGGVFFSNILAGTANIFGEIPLGGAANINSGGLLPLMNFAVGLKVIAGLFAIVLIMTHAINNKEEAS